jgi:TonB family protein
MSSAVAWRTLEGNTVDGKFPLRHWLGESERSAVFLTERMLRGVTGAQKAAIKLIAVDQTDAAAQLSRWQAAGQLTHPHLIRIFDSGRCQIDGEKFLYIVTEFAEEDLSQILPHRPLTPGEASDMLPPLLDALSYLHAKGFIQGHIRPSNVLAVGDQLKLSSDQIISSGAGSDKRRRDVFDAPETAMGIFTPESDVWSVGATLVAALAQGSGLSGETAHGDPPLPPAMPEPFRGIARECLRLDPKRRSSIAEIVARLQPAGRSVPAEPAQPAATPRRSSRAIVTIAIIAVALLVGLIAFFSRGKNAPQSAGSGPSSSQQSSQSQSGSAQSGSSQPAAASPSTALSNQPSKPSTPPSVSANPPAYASQTPPAVISKPPAAPIATPQPPSASGDGVVHRVLPEVSQNARNTITGRVKVVVRVDVDATGKVTAAKLTSPGPSRYFAKLALNAAQGWEFSPAQANGQPAASAWTLHFRFGRRGTEVSPVRVHP